MHNQELGLNLIPLSCLHIIRSHWRWALLPGRLC